MYSDKKFSSLFNYFSESSELKSIEVLCVIPSPRVRGAMAKRFVIYDGRNTSSGIGTGTLYINCSVW
jgi:hypothetical protein